MAKTKSFLSSRSTQPGSASDEDFAAAIGTISPSAAARHVFSQNIPAERIEPNPFQARKTFPDLDELADAIRTQGFTSRLRVRAQPQRDGHFQLVYGERRLRAAKLAGLREIPCDVADYSDAELIEIGLAENIQRRDLNPLEEAQAFAQLTGNGRYTIRELALKIGKNKDYIAGRLALLRAPEDVQQLVMQMPEALTAARRIAALTDINERRPLIEGILRGDLTKEAVRATVRDVRVRPDVQNGDGFHEENVSHERSSITPKRVERDTALVLGVLETWQTQLPGLPRARQTAIRTAITKIRAALDAME